MPINVLNRGRFNSDWPRPSNTGVPSGTSLTPHSGNFTTSSNGQIVQDLDIAGELVIGHQNVIVRRCRIIMPNEANRIAPIFIATGAGGVGSTLTVEDCELDGSNRGGSSGIFYDSMANPPAVTARRLRIHRVENGIGCLSGFDMRDSLVDGLNPDGADPHTDGLQTTSGTSNVTLIHNVFDMRAPDTGANNSCIQFDVNAPSNFNWLIENNKLLLSTSNGGACLRIPLGDATGNNIRIRNNRLSPGSINPPNLDYRIPSDAATNHITEWSGNVDDTTGEAVA